MKRFKIMEVFGPAPGTPRTKGDNFSTILLIATAIFLAGSILFGLYHLMLG